MPKTYDEKRDFKKTPEPKMQKQKGGGPLTFVIQKHAATSLHYDFRIELDGVLKSWAVPKGPSYNPKDKRLAMMVEDHPLDYASFEGIIPKGNYGGGEVIVWDNGIYSPDEDGRLLFYDREDAQEEMRKGLAKGKISLFLRGTKMKGSWALVQMKGKKNEWLLFKHNDEFADPEKDITTDDASVISGLTLQDLKEGKKPKAVPHSVSSVKPEDLPGAKKAKFPKTIIPMAASLTENAFSDPEWLFEPKMDGIRALAMIKDGSLLLITRNGNDICRQYPKLVEALGNQIAKEMILDGEIIAFDAKGQPSFHQLQQRMNLQRDADIKMMDNSIPVYYYVFDLLYLDGYDITGSPLVDRKQLLSKVLIPSERVSVMDYFQEEGEAAYEAAKQHGLEGVVAKRRNSKYEPGKRSANWLKIKTTKSDDFVIGGYIQGLGNRADTFGSLLLGTWDENGKLVYVGNVGTGFDDKALASYKEKFDKLKAAKSPFAHKVPLKTPATWMKPELVAEVKFAQWTPDGHLRAPVFLHLREDLDAEDVHRTEVLKAPTSAKVSKRAESCVPEDVIGQIKEGKKEFTITCEGHRVSITNPDKLLWPETESHRGYTKRDFLTYLARVSPYLLPHLKDRPMTLSRYPNGIEGGMFYQKHWEHKLPEFVEVVRLYSEQFKEDQEYLICNNLPSLLWLGQLADLELHPWTSRTNPEPDAHELPTEFTGSAENVDSSVLNYPDYLLFDLDPYIYSGKEKEGDEPEFNNKAYEKGREAAFWVKQLLDSLSLTSFVKTSGKTGLHIYVPILRHFTYDQVRSAAATICNFVLREHPEDITTEWAVVKRKGKIFMDYNQNSRGKTLSSIYSTRALRLATASFPLTWDDLSKHYPTEFTMETVPPLLEKNGDAWADILAKKNDLQSLIK